MLLIDGSAAMYQRSLLRQVKDEQIRLRKNSDVVVGGHVRKNYRDGLSKLAAKGALLHQALSKGVMPETVTLYRDTCISFMGLGLDKNATQSELRHLLNTTQTNNIFTSTSFSTLDLKGRDTRMIITVPKGYQGCQYIKPVVHSQFRAQEEVLFDAPLTYKINRATINETGKILLYVEVLMKDGS